MVGWLANAGIAHAAPLEDLLSATCRIAGQQSSGTCFLVATGDAQPAETSGPTAAVLVTAAHFFEGVAEADCRIVVRSQAADGSYVRSELTIPIRDGDAPRWRKHPELDIAALRVELPPGTAMRPIPLDRQAEERHALERAIHVGQDVFIPGFPARLEANEAGWPVLRKGMIASHPLTPLPTARTILIAATTFGGDSGAPVAAIADDAPLIVGLVLGMHRQTDTSTLPFEERTIHTPLGLAIVVQAPFIRETIGMLGD
jgi:hypothetical protein